MKVIPGALQTELSKTSARIATCLWVQRRDGNVYGFTTSSNALTIDGVAYLPASSIDTSDIDSGSELDTDNLDVQGQQMSSVLTEDDVRAGRWDFAKFRIFQVNWASIADGQKKDRAGHLGKITITALGFKAELLGKIEAYGTSIGKITQMPCRTSLGTAECGHAATTVTGTVLLCETDFFTLTDASRTEADGFFEEGTITFTSGPANGLSYEIKSYVLAGSGGPTFVTKTAVAYDVTGATYTMTEGCPRTWIACTVRFSNGKNFRGEPWLRGNDVMLQIGRHTG